MGSSTGANRQYETFAGDRYERLDQGAAVVAADPALDDGDFPFDAHGLRLLVGEIASQRLLDHLSEAHANMVCALVLIDFTGGAHRLGARIRSLLTAARTPSHDTLAVVSGLAAVLALMVDSTVWEPAPSNEPG